MKTTALAFSISLACALTTYAQTTQPRASGEVANQTSARMKQAGNIHLESGTRVTGELQNSLDVRKAKVGDQVILKTTKAIKSGGRTVVDKGSRLVGQVTEVAQKTSSNAESHIAILFDRLEHGSLALPITATISSITDAKAIARSNSDDMFGGNTSAGAPASSTSSGRTSGGGGNGGLLGGVGSVVNSTTSTVGSVVGGTTSAVGSTVDSTTSGVGRSLNGIQISESSNTSVEGSSVLSLQGGNLRLEKGTSFNLLLTQSANAGTAKPQ